jgi:superoxide reductase
MPCYLWDGALERPGKLDRLTGAFSHPGSSSFAVPARRFENGCERIVVADNSRRRTRQARDGDANGGAKDGRTNMGMGEILQSADWKKEKHVPVIDCPDRVKADQVFKVDLTIGKEVAHPNSVEHHIRWIALYFQPGGDKFAYQVGFFEFCAHGESVNGVDLGPVYTHHAVTAQMQISQPGTLHSMSLCNIHGLWEYSKEITVE